MAYNKPSDRKSRPQRSRDGKDGRRRPNKNDKGGKPFHSGTGKGVNGPKPERKENKPVQGTVAPVKKRLVRKGGAAPTDPILELFHTPDPTLDMETITTLVREAGVEEVEELPEKYLKYISLIIEMNEEINLVSRARTQYAALLSLLDSLTGAIKTSHLMNEASLLDLGSGGGFPGIVCKLYAPGLHVTLLDARRAKALALKQICTELGLDDVVVAHDRAETFPDHEESRFDLVTIRGVGSLKETLPMARPLLKPEGTILAWKGPEGLREFQDGPQEEFDLIKRHHLTSIRSLYEIKLKS